MCTIELEIGRTTATMVLDLHASKVPFQTFNAQTLIILLVHPPMPFLMVGPPSSAATQVKTICICNPADRYQEPGIVWVS